MVRMKIQRHTQKPMLAAGSMGVGGGTQVYPSSLAPGHGGRGTEGSGGEATWLSQPRIMFSLAGDGIPLKVPAPKEQCGWTG